MWIHHLAHCRMLTCSPCTSRMGTNPSCLVQSMMARAYDCPCPKFHDGGETYGGTTEVRVHNVDYPFELYLPLEELTRQFRTLQAKPPDLRRLLFFCTWWIVGQLFLTLVLYSFLPCLVLSFFPRSSLFFRPNLAGQRWQSLWHQYLLYIFPRQT
jgi:hypothetical protein